MWTSRTTKTQPVISMLFYNVTHNLSGNFCKRFLFLFQLAYLSKSMPTGNMLVKRLVEDLDRQMQAISEHEDALMGQVRETILMLLSKCPTYQIILHKRTDETI